jgi:chromosome transmission fidelity protein 1
MKCCRWRETGLEKQLMQKKRVFWEARDASDCDTALKLYQAHLRSSAVSGAVIFCVVGGKLSEGINFGDELARCVVVMGLPYPDLSDPELKERLMHADRRAGTCISAGSGSSSNGGQIPAMGPAGREMYSNMCMQAVNQCVGRAIRHAGDYSAVLLVDARYTGSQPAGGAGRNSQSVVGKLPSWLTRRWTDCPDSFGKAVHALGSFYASMRSSAAT